MPDPRTRKTSVAHALLALVAGVAATLAVAALVPAARADASSTASPVALPGIPECAPRRRVVKLVPPSVPPATWPRGITAETVRFAFTVETDGTVRDVSVLGEDARWDAMRAAMRQSMAEARFDPPPARCRQWYDISVKLWTGQGAAAR